MALVTDTHTKAESPEWTASVPTTRLGATNQVLLLPKTPSEFPLSDETEAPSRHSLLPAQDAR